MDELTLQVGGRKLTGWTEVRLKRSIDELASSFSVAYVDHLEAKRRVRMPVGARCVLSVAGETLATGYVDEVSTEYDRESYRFEVSGRSLAGDLVDCSVVHESGVWILQTVTEIAREICQPFGIGVSAPSDVGEPLGYFAVQTGEAAFEALTRLARMRGFLLTSTVNGNVVFGRAGRGRAGTLTLGDDLVLRGGLRASTRDRHSEYRVLAQEAGGYDDSPPMPDAMTVATDANVRRYRPLIVMAEHADGDLDRRAAWERSVRAGKSRRYSYTLRGWRSPTGALWAPNQIVRVEDSLLDAVVDLLVVSVELSLGAEGPQTTIELTSPAAYDVLEIPEEEEGGFD